MKRFILLGVVAVLLGAGAYVAATKWSSQAAPVPSTENTNTGTPTTIPTGQPQAQTMQVKIALLNTTGEGTGKKRGCDTVVLVSRTVPQSPAPLAAALKALFVEPEGSQPDTEYNFIARTKSTLTFDRATITSGTANIYLKGSLSGLAGVCDDPRAAIQIEETALQFPTVKKVQLYLNDKPTNLMPSQN
jgi:spore germination protein GerM